MSVRERSDRGQAPVEFAIITPVLLQFVLLTVDVGLAYWQSIDAAGAARAGARMGIISDTSDIGSAVRDEPNSGIPNTVSAWGNEGPGQPDSVCTSSNATCGDPSGCTPSSFSGSQFACFAVRTCTLSSGTDLGNCVSFGPWGQRPVPGGGHAIQVLVVIKFIAATPALAQFLGPGGPACPPWRLPQHEALEEESRRAKSATGQAVLTRQRRSSLVDRETYAFQFSLSRSIEPVPPSLGRSAAS